MNSFQEFLNVYASLLGQGIADTLAMLLISTFFAYIIGLFLGIVLYVTEPTGLRPHKALNAVLGWIINKTMGLRVTEDEEYIGMDLAQHGEQA